MNNKFKAQNLNWKSYRNFICHDLASHALNMSGYFDQSGCSIESRCVVISEEYAVSKMDWQPVYDHDLTEWINVSIKSTQPGETTCLLPL